MSSNIDKVMSSETPTRSNVLLIATAVVIILIGITVTGILIISSMSDTANQPNPFSKVVSVGPVWNSDSWTCFSDRDFVVHGASDQHTFFIDLHVRA